MFQLKGPHEAEDVQGHLGNVHCMPVAISHRQAAGHHVGIADGFYLWKHVLISGSAPRETELNRTFTECTYKGWGLSVSSVLVTSSRARPMPTVTC